MGAVRLSGAAWGFGGTWATTIWVILVRMNVHFRV